jgi:hypothetical protein
MNETIKRGRGKGVKPAMIYLPVRVSKEVADFFDAYPNKSAKIREVLANYVQQNGETNEKETQQDH